MKINIKLWFVNTLIFVCKPFVYLLLGMMHVYRFLSEDWYFRKG